MSILAGVGLLVAGSLFYCYCFGMFRRADRPKWTLLAGIAATVCMVSMFVLTVGFGLVFKGLLHPVVELVSIQYWGILAAPVMVAFGYWAAPRLIAPAYRVDPAIGAEFGAVNCNVAPSSAVVAGPVAA